MTARVGVGAAVGQPEGGVILVVVRCGGVTVIETMSEKGPTHVEYAEARFHCQSAKLRVGIVQTGQQ